jgi:hypothetical protein
MKDSTFAVQVFAKELAATPIEVTQSLRLLKAFLKLPPDQQSEIIELLEHRAKQHADRLLS